MVVPKKQRQCDYCVYYRNVYNPQVDYNCRVVYIWMRVVFMQVEELYPTYFDLNCKDLPYRNDREYVTDLLALLDIILNIACAYKGMNDTEAPLNVSDVHLRGLSISPAEIVDALLSYRRDERSKGKGSSLHA